MVVIATKPAHIADTPVGLAEPAYRDWLFRFCDMRQKLTGTYPLQDLRLIRPLRRWYLAGLTPYQACVRVGRWYVRNA